MQQLIRSCQIARQLRAKLTLGHEPLSMTVGTIAGS